MTTIPTLPPELDPRRPGPISISRPATPRRSRRRPANVLRGLAIGTATATLAASGLLWAVYARVDGNIEKLSGITNGGGDDKTTFLLVGSDSRAGEANEAVQAGSEMQVSGARSDTAIMATFGDDGEAASLVSFPRDSWVSIPAHTSRSGQQVPKTDERINSAFELGGPGLLVDTLEALTGQEIDHYVEIDFAGFQQVVDALGGVTVCLTEPAQDELSGVDLPAGESTLDGAQALAFVRQRKNLPGGDLDRIGRQQAFLASVVRQATATGTLLNLGKLTSLIDALSQSVRVDDGLSVDGLKDFGLRFQELSAGQVTFATAPVLEQRRIDDKAVLILDEDMLKAIFETGAPIPSPEPSDVELTPGDVSVSVLNGGGVQGLARRAADKLASLGFGMTGAPGNAETSGATETVIIHPPDESDAARIVQLAIPGSILEPDPAAAEITVVVGTSYDTRDAAAPPPSTSEGSQGQPAAQGVAPTTEPVVPTSSASELTCTA